MARRGTKTRDERLFSAAVLRRSFELQDREYAAGFRFVYEGVLRDLGLEDADVDAYLAAHRAEVEAAIGRGGSAQLTLGVARWSDGPASTRRSSAASRRSGSPLDAGRARRASRASPTGSSPGTGR